MKSLAKCQLRALGLFVLLSVGKQCSAAEITLFLHGTPTNTVLNGSAPIGTNAQTASSAAIDRTNFVEISTWNVAPSAFYFDLTAIGDLSLWLGRRFTDSNGSSSNSENTGTFFDLRAEILKNGRPVSDATGLITFLRNVKADPDKATPVSISFGAISTVRFNRGDILALRISAKVSESSGQPEAPGASLFFDSVDRPARLGISYYVIPEISIIDASILEGDAETNAPLAITLSLPAERTVSVDYAAHDGTATIADSDYAPVLGTLSFDPGETNKPIFVRVNGDLRNEADETVLINLGNATNGVIPTSEGVLTVVNDDPLPDLSISSVAIREGDAGGTVAVLNVSLSAVSGQTVSVDYATAAGTASVVDSDYAPVNGVLSFAPGETNKTISVQVNGDTRNEADETVVVNLSNPVNVVLAVGASGTLMIVNDDPLPSLTINSASMEEGDSGTTNVFLDAVLSAVSGQTVSADFATADGMATVSNSDYVGANGTLVFQPGETQKAVTVTIVGDRIFEPDEVFVINITDPVHATVSGSGTVTILNDDRLVVTLSSPPSGLVTNGNQVNVTGAAGPGDSVRIEGSFVTVSNIADVSGAFSITVPLKTNQINHLFAIGTDASGTPTAPQPLDIIQDSQSPNLFIDFPIADAELAVDSIDVAGRVGDILSGFMGLRVTVNGQSATVDVGIGNNGTFVRGAVPLVLGTNMISATAVDIAGNAITRQIKVKRVPIVGPSMTAMSGNGQITNVHRPLRNPIIVKVTETNGAAFANKIVTFEVIRSDGRLVADPGGTEPGRMLLQVRTDNDGLAAAYWTLGGDAGCGNNRVAVTSKDIAGSIFFCASALPARPSQINVGSGNNQKAEVGGPANEPLRAWVSDSCNGVPNILVTFTVIEGGGKVNGLDSVTIPTANTGHAQVDFTLGPEPGKNIIEANFPGNPGNPATFIVYGLERDPTQPTSFTGLILDNASQPIGGAICSLTVGGGTLMATSDAQGQFAFANTPSGRGDLFVNGLTANSLAGNFISPNSFPFLSYSVTLVPNTENSLPMPVLLPRLNPNNNVVYRGTNDLVLTCEGIAGLKMTIKASSMRKADGSLVTPQNPAVVSLNQVKHDSVPMPIPDGAAPPFTWTLQPARSTFDPPIQIEYPNMSGLPAGGIAFFLSYNHDTERFDIIASGHVVDDGSVIVTDAGAGLSVAGWGCNCPPYSVTEDCDNCDSGDRRRGGRRDEDDCRKCDCSDSKALDFQMNYLRDVALAFSLLPPFTGYARDHLNKFLDGTGGDNHYGNNSNPVNDIKNHPNYKKKHEALLEIIRQMVADAGGASSIPDFVQQFGGIRFYDGGLPKNQLAAGVGQLSEGYKAYVTGVTIDGDEVKGSIHYSMRDYYHFDPSDCKKSGPDAMACCLENCGQAKPYYNHFDFDVPFDFSLSAPGPLLLSASIVSAQDIITQTDMPPPTTLGPALDDNFVVRVNGQLAAPETNGLFVVANVSAADLFGEGPGTPPDFKSDDFLRVLGTAQIAGEKIYAFSQPFQITRGEPTLVRTVDIYFTDSPPPLPVSLRISVDNPTLNSVGQNTQLHVAGTLQDGSQVDVTPRTKWTVYRTSNPNVAIVDRNGRVTARGNGVAYLTAVNEGAAAVAQVIVALGPLMSVEGFVRFENGTPVGGADVSIFGLPYTSVSRSDGSFTISGVPSTVTSNLTVRARITLAGTNYVGSSTSVAPVPDGIADAGIIVVRRGGGNLGPIIISGMDPEDHDTAGTDMIRDIMSFVVRNSALHQTPTRIVMFGGGSSVGNTARSIASGLGFILTQVTGAGITSANLDPLTTPYDVIYMPTAVADISGGLSQSDLNLINARSTDIINFVNRGGGLAAFAQNLSGGFAWFPLGGLTAVSLGSSGLNGIAVTPDGAFILSASATAVEPFHQAFIGPIGFFGLKVLATESGGSQRPLIIGGLASIPSLPVPTPQARSSEFSVNCLTNGCMQLTFSAPDDGAYMIEASTNLVNWSSMTTVIAADGVIQLLDEPASRAPYRFYRAKRL